MVCPNCGSNISDKRKRCDRCGTDLSIYRKILRASNLYYNNGLAKAKVRDLSGAILALRKSLELNKFNTNARNLLGLVYYEVGETVAALSEWVISRHFQPKDNDADEYINRVQSNLTRLDALNQAIKRYNTALGFAKQGNDDLAIIQLKKVVNLNPNFIRAYQLLALLLMKTGDKVKAKKYLLKISKIDVNNTTTLRYLRELEEPVAIKNLDNPEAELSNEGSGINTIRPISSYREDKPNIMVFVNLVIGIAIGVAVMAILVIPTIKRNINSEEHNDIIDSGYTISQIEEKNKIINDLRSENDELAKKVTELQTQLDNIPEPEDKSLVYIPLYDAIGLYYTELEKPANQRDFSETAERLLTVDASKMEIESAVVLYNRLTQEIYPVVAKKHYEIGHDYYGAGRYEDALTELEKALALNPTDVNAVYFIGRAYHRMGDKENAALYYNKVITEFPDSKRVSEATDFLKQVQD